METLTFSAHPKPEPAVQPAIPFCNPIENKPSLQQVFAIEESPLLRYAHGLVGQHEIAQDLVQDAFLKLHAQWENVTNPRAWLFRAIHNLALNHLRDHRRETSMNSTHEWQSDAPDPEQALGRLEAIGSLQRLVSELSPDDRSLIALKYHENLKYHQISTRTGLSVGNVGYKLHHALKHLADSLRRLGIESPEG
jgi:RNA polymerase sigma-70 factor (ECF subfamily)